MYTSQKKKSSLEEVNRGRHLKTTLFFLLLLFVCLFAGAALIRGQSLLAWTVVAP